MQHIHGQHSRLGKKGGLPPLIQTHSLIRVQSHCGRVGVDLSNSGVITSAHIFEPLGIYDIY